MVQPIICDYESKTPVFPVPCPDGYWAIPVNDLSEITNPNRDHAYILPDNSVWILNHDGTGMMQLANDGEGGQPTLIKNEDGYIIVTGNGTYGVTLDINYEELKEAFDFYTKSETDEKIFEAIAGEEITVTHVIDFKNKTAGSLVENPNVAKWGGGATLQLPNSTSLTELNQARYDNIMYQDSAFATVKTSTAESRIQIELEFAILQDIEHRYPNLFLNRGATSIEEKNKIILDCQEQMVFHVHANGSGATGNRVAVARLSGTSYVNAASSTEDAIKDVSGAYTDGRLLQTDGKVHLNVNALAASETIASIVNLRYASLEYTLKLKASDLYALKSEVYTKKESDTKFYKNSQVIPSNANLNDYKEEGFFNCETNTVAATILNIPAPYAFTLQVNKTSLLSSGSQGWHQRLVTFQNDATVEIYERNFYVSWGVWIKQVNKADLDLKANISAAQMNKITSDDGRPVGEISSSIITSVLNRAPGMKAYTFTNTATDYPATAGTSMRGYAYMASATYGYVFAVDIKGNSFVRAIVNSNWVGDWKELSGGTNLTAGDNITIAEDVISVKDASTTEKGVVQLTNAVTSTSISTAATANSVKALNDKVELKQDKLTAGDNITIENNVISATGGGSTNLAAGTGIYIDEDLGTTTISQKEIVRGVTSAGMYKLSFYQNSNLNFVKMVINGLFLRAKSGSLTQTIRIISDIVSAVEEEQFFFDAIVKSSTQETVTVTGTYEVDEISEGIFNFNFIIDGMYKLNDEIPGSKSERLTDVNNILYANSNYSGTYDFRQKTVFL